MSKQIPWSIQAATGSTFSALRRTPFAKVTISTLMLENVISVLCAPLPSISTPGLLFLFSEPLYITDDWHPVFNPSSPLLGSLVATPVITSALCDYFSSLLWLTRSLHRHAYQMVQRCVSDQHSRFHQYYRGGSKPTHRYFFCIFLLSWLFL